MTQECLKKTGCFAGQWSGFEVGAFPCLKSSSDTWPVPAAHCGKGQGMSSVVEAELQHLEIKGGERPPHRAEETKHNY